MSKGANRTKVFPTRLRGLMGEQDVTRSALAQTLGVTRQAVANYLDGTSSPSWENVALISRTLGVTSDYLLGLSNSRVYESEEDVQETVSVCPLLGGVPCAKERCAVYRNGKCLIPRIVNDAMNEQQEGTT